MPGKLKQVSVGGESLIGVQKGGKVYFRKGIRPIQPFGDQWVKVPSQGHKLTRVSTNDDTVWSLDTDGNVFRGNGFTKTKPESLVWKQATGVKLKKISTAGNSLWGVNNDDIPFCRLGISTENPDGYGWQRGQSLGLGYIQGLKQVSTDGKSVWGVNENDDIYFLEGISTIKPEGTNWVKADIGNMKQVSIGGNALFGVQKDDTLFFRTGISTSNPQGTEWVEVKDKNGKGKKMKEVEVASDGKSLWGVQENNSIWRRVYEGGV